MHQAELEDTRTKASKSDEEGDRSSSSSSSSSENESDIESDAEPAAVLTRERRANAGNRYSKLLAAEEKADADAADADFYTAEGWQEHADDAAFSGSDAEAPDDVSLHSDSSDNEDEGADAADDQGERELKKQERAERAGRSKKRKTMQDVYRPRPVKVPRMAASGERLDGAAPRPKKKSERASWMPAEGAGPQRQSSRKLAVENKARVHERLEKAEKHRLRTLAIMQAADRRKAESRAKEMTQEERLAEAVDIEKKNAKSLNRWEENEKLREEERRERLAAMKNRQLEGPYIRYWSGQCVWCADNIQHIGKGANIQEIEVDVNFRAQEKFRKTQEREKKEREAALLAATDHGQADTAPGGAIVQPQAPQARPSQDQPQAEQETYPSTIMFPPPQSGNLLEGIHHWASLPGQTPHASHMSHLLAPQAQNPAAVLSHSTSGNMMPPLAPLQQPIQPPQPPPQPAPQPPPHFHATLAMHTLIALENFKDLADPPFQTAKSRAKDKDEKDRNTISHALLGFHQPAKGAKHATAHTQQLCEITRRPARYRDPVTGLPYADSYAYKCIQRLVGGACEWSNLLGAFVGPSGAEGGVGRPAHGVPDGFIAKARVPPHP